MTSPPWSIDYRDGSANAFRARDDGRSATFEFVPVTPEQSSTGRYSGGAPKSGPLAAADVEALWALVHALDDDGAVHTTERGKGTGAFSLRDATGTRDYIVQRCPALAALDELITRL